ncbi:hypothetical protein [Nonomuraea sp. NPDC050643]|uniref:hypothetical protein n=1 Tax=Nonomuraea sp. NPDC050643 TaxID=3155660 RepID=UPI0033D98E13
MSGRAEAHQQPRDVTGGRPWPSVSGAIDGLVSTFALIAGDTGNTRMVAPGGTAGPPSPGEAVSATGRHEPTQAENHVEWREPVPAVTDVERRDPAQAEIGVGRWELVEIGIGVERREPVQVEIDVARREPVQAGVDVERRAPGRRPSDERAEPVAGGALFASRGLVSSRGSVSGGGPVLGVTARSRWYSGQRQFMACSATAAATFGVGNVIRASGL